MTGTMPPSASGTWDPGPDDDPRAVPQAPVEPLAPRIAQLCAQAEARLAPGPTRDAVAAVRARLTEPTISVAVGGMLNAGKSTLVNALLGQRLAPTDATECTRVPTWFRYHHSNRVFVHPRQGEPRSPLPPPGGGVPPDLGAPAEEIGQVVVEAPNARLRDDYTVLDTPGLNSLTVDDTRALSAMAEADALIYVMRMDSPPGERDRATLEGLRALTGSARVSAANVIGVLSRIDLRADADGEPWEAARRVARRYATALRTDVVDVVPVAGLLAETALGAHFNESDMHCLRLLAGTPGRESALFSDAHFRAWPDAPSETDACRGRLLDLLGLYGLRVSLQLIDGGCRAAGDLLRRLRHVCGVDDLLSRIRETFTRDADRLRAGAALVRLDAVVWGGSDADERLALTALRSGLHRLRDEAAMRRIDLDTALADLNAGRFALPEADATALVHVVTGRTAAARLGLPPTATAWDLEAMADAQIDRWAILASGPSRVVARHAAVVRDAFEELYFQVTDGR